MNRSLASSGTARDWESRDGMIGISVPKAPGMAWSGGHERRGYTSPKDCTRSGEIWLMHRGGAPNAIPMPSPPALRRGAIFQGMPRLRRRAGTRGCAFTVMTTPTSTIITSRRRPTPNVGSSSANGNCLTQARASRLQGLRSGMRRRRRQVDRGSVRRMVAQISVPARNQHSPTTAPEAARSQPQTQDQIRRNI